MPLLWSVSSGKGGVGKSFITSNLGVSLTRSGKSVVIIDLNVHAPVQHTLFGLHCESSLNHYFTNDVNSNIKFSTLLKSTDVPRLSILKGHDSIEPFDFSEKGLNRLIQACKTLSADIVLFDLSSAENFNNNFIFSLCDQNILICDPEPHSIENTYRFFEHWISYSLASLDSKFNSNFCNQSLKDFRSFDKKTKLSFSQYFYKKNNLDVASLLNQKCFSLIINQARNSLDKNLGHSIKSVVYKYYGLKLKYIDAIDYDNAAWQSIRNMSPLLVDFPFSPIVGQFQNINRSILSTEILPSYRQAVI
jgi:flagellar biosynthesis protein FlhG